MYEINSNTKLLRKVFFLIILIKQKYIGVMYWIEIKCIMTLNNMSHNIGNRNLSLKEIVTLRIPKSDFKMMHAWTMYQFYIRLHCNVSVIKVNRLAKKIGKLINYYLYLCLFCNSQFIRSIIALFKFLH